MPRSSAPDRRAFAARARAWGVETSWVDAAGRRHQVPVATLEALLAALGAHEGEAPPEAAPPSLGPPRRCHLPEGLRTWGFAVQLYSLRSRRSWGLGDYGDLRDLARWSASLGAGVLLLNPVHFSTPVAPVPPSPYSPSSRRFREPLYLRVEDVPGAREALGADLATLQRQGTALNDAPLIDRDAVFALKLGALRRVFRHVAAHDAADLDAWRSSQGADLDAFGVWCALAEEHGASWPAWPAALQRRGSREVAGAASRLRETARFHVWLQWQVDRQLAAAAHELPLLHDLAIGVDPGGVDAWLWPSAVARGVHVGAPPDLFNTQGQDWGIAPFHPWGLLAAGFAPFADVLRACLRGAGGLRIDHVMGLARLYWIPPGATPRDGAYVRYPANELFDVLAAESVRAQAFVVGEDLGTVQRSMRRQMAARDVLSYRLLWFEDDAPALWPQRALAAVTTHDLPTVAGVWTGADLRDQQRAGTRPDVARNTELRSRLARVARLSEDASVADAVLGAYRALSGAPSAVVLATLEDALAVAARPNMPGASREQWPSWSLPLPLPLEELSELPLPRRIAEVLGRRSG